MLFLIFLKVFMSGRLIVRLLQSENIQYITDGIILRGFQRLKTKERMDYWETCDVQDLRNERPVQRPCLLRVIGLLTGFVLQRKVEKNSDYHMTENRVCTACSRGTWKYWSPEGGFYFQPLWRVCVDQCLQLCVCPRQWTSHARKSQQKKALLFTKEPVFYYLVCVGCSTHDLDF